MELFKNTNYDFLGKKWPFIIASLVLTVIGLASLVMKGGPRYGIDFRGGTLVYVKFADRPPIERLRSALTAKLGGLPEVQEVTGNNEVIIGTELREDREQERARAAIIDTLATTFGQQQTGQKPSTYSWLVPADKSMGTTIVSPQESQTQLDSSFAGTVAKVDAGRLTGRTDLAGELSGTVDVCKGGKVLITIKETP